jgi:uncharacterized protein (DUF1800 family)
MALALSETFVVSMNSFKTLYPSYLIAAYWDVLTAHAFGNFRQLLEVLTLNAGMGSFLNTRGNLGENTRGRQPDENFAREVMQLFTIGLYELNPDGTYKVDANSKPVETYSQDDVTNLARVFTGYDWDFLSNGGTSTPVSWERFSVPSTHLATNPMRFNSNKSFPGSRATFSARRSPSPPPARMPCTSRSTACSITTTPARSSRGQMIQRLVTSNPTPAYVQRVATVFGTTAPACAVISRRCGPPFSRMRKRAPCPPTPTRFSARCASPSCAFVQWARTAEITSSNGEYEIDDLSAPDTMLGQSPLRSPSVFNFFRPWIRSTEHRHRHRWQGCARVPVAQ